MKIDDLDGYIAYAAELTSCGVRITNGALNVEKLQLLANGLHTSAYPIDATRFEQVEA